MLSSSEDISKTQSKKEEENEKERIIPLYEEQFEISKKMVKVPELVISKRRVTEKKKINIDISTQKK